MFGHGSGATPKIKRFPRFRSVLTVRTLSLGKRNTALSAFVQVLSFFFSFRLLFDIQWKMVTVTRKLSYEGRCRLVPYECYGNLELRTNFCFRRTLFPFRVDRRCLDYVAVLRRILPALYPGRFDTAPSLRSCQYAELLVRGHPTDLNVDRKRNAYAAH